MNTSFLKSVATFLFLAILTFWSCNKCDDVSCFTPPSSFAFQLISTKTGEDLILNNAYQVQDIQIIAGFDNSTLKLDTTTTATNVVFISNEIGWQTGADKKNYTLKVGDQHFKFIYHTETENQNCCSFTEIKTIDFDTLSNSKSPATNIFSILL